jgi:hypothetical protein
MTPQEAVVRLRSTIAAGTGSFLIVEKNLYDMHATDLVTQVLDELDRLREENLLLRKRVVDELNILENGK